MEGRARRDGDLVRRSRSFSGRQVPLEMGKVRVGGSGRPVPAAFAHVAARRAGTSSQEAAAPQEALESYPRSPFRRKEELSETVVRVAQESPGSGFHVRKAAGPHPLSARSPQILDRRNRSIMGEFAAQSTEMKVENGEDFVAGEHVRAQHVVHKSVERKRASVQLEERRFEDEMWGERAEHVVNKTQARKREAVDSGGDLVGQGVGASPVALIPNSPIGKVRVARLMEEGMVSSNSEDINATEVYNRHALVLPTPRVGAGTFVSSMPSLTKLRSAFTARELLLFTQRLDSAEQEDNVQTRYHVASHAHSTAAAKSAASFETNQEIMGNGSAGNTQKRSIPSSIRRQAATSEAKNENGQAGSSWRRVDSSIDHIYDDPSIDMVQLYLLHSHHTTTGHKKRKMVERERVLAAASGLRENKSEELRRQEQAHDRKLQIQKMSEAIRLQNQRAVRARSVRSARLDDRCTTHGRRSESAPTLPERKPAVPRLSGNGKQQQAKRRSKPNTGASGNHGGVSASILMGSESNVSTREDEVQESERDGKNVVIPKAEPVDHQAVKRRPLATSPRLFNKKKRQEVPAQQVDVEAAVKAREERRAIAREYMQLQKQSRRIWSAKAKEQSQLEHDKRQQQLEILEATRLKNLRLSRKRANHRKKQEEDIDQLFPESASPDTVGTTIIHSSSTLKDTDGDAGTNFTTKSEASRMNKESFLDEPRLNRENDQAFGNVNLAEHLFDLDMEMENSQAKRSGGLLSTRETEQNTEADERVQKLLQLREKASALSARLSGLRNRTGTTEVTVSSNDVIEYERVIDPSDSATVSKCDSSDTVLPHFDELQLASVYTPGQDDELSADHGSDQSSEKENEKAHDRRSDSSSAYGDDQAADHMANLQGSPKEDEDDGAEDDEDNDENATSSVTRTRQVVLHNEEFRLLASGAGVYDVDEGEDIDVRSIGVHNIGVVWPVEQESKAEKPTSPKRIARSASACSSSSLSSAVSSPSPAPARRATLSAQMNDSFDEENGAFEVAFYKQLKNRLHASEYATAADHAMSDETITRYRGDSKDDTSDSDIDPERASKPKIFSTSRVVSQEPARSYGESSQPNAGLMRLIEETDDSLSVIDRAAKKLYYEQCEKVQRAKEEELQRRIQAEKEELLRKDLVLKAVMASLNGADSDGDEMDGSENDVGLYSDDERGMESSPYKRLEEIMDEVDNERAREKEESDCSLGYTLQPEEADNQIFLERMQHRDTKLGVRHHEGVRVPTSSSSPAFWDQMVAESTGNDFSVHPDPGNVNRPRVKIDKSDLIAQRESRLREEDDQMSGSPPREHSPRTLSRRLMAAVDYQEAIHEAHMQLSMMEHAHELETVQAETITLAHAFKEEMDNTATTHQLALDHATLEKKFDGEMHEVLQQLGTIQQEEEQEQLVNKARTEKELKLANSRECSAQTETAQCADAATSAMLCVDTSTSPARLLVDAAVQHDAPTPKTEVPFVAVDAINELEYASDEEGDAYEETFEKESPMHENLRLRDSNVESQTRDPSQIEEESESEIQSVLFEAAENDSFDESDVATSIVEYQSIVGASASLAVSAVESIIADEMNENHSDDACKESGAASASVDYDDDFEASSPNMKEVRNQAYHAATIEEDVDDELEGSGSIASSQSDDDAIVEHVDENHSDDDLEENGGASASVDYDDDFETSSPKMKELRNQAYHAATIQEDVDDKVEESGSIDSHRSGDAIEERVEEESGSTKIRDEVVSEQEESGHYSSQFESMARGDSGNTKQAVRMQTVTDPYDLNASTTPVPRKVALLTLDNQELNAFQPADDIADAYILDLDRRKQAEESLLNLRLQAIEHKFQHEEEQLDKAFGHKQSEVRALHELRMRKETLTMAFFAEKANIESLKAASTARYYQDLHTFRSLSLDWPTAMYRASGGDQDDAFKSERLRTRQSSVVVPSHVHRTPNNRSAHVPGNADLSISPLRPDEYTDEFASDLQRIHEHARGETIHQKNDELDESRSIVSELSEVAEENDVERGDEEDIPNEAEEEYEDEFASMSEDTTVQKTAVIDDIDAVESSQISDEAMSDGEHISIVSEHSEIVDAAIKSWDSSEIDEDDDIDPGNEADVPNEEEEEYNDEFASMSEDTTAQKTTVNEDIEVVESGQLLDQAISDSEHSEKDGEIAESRSIVSEHSEVIDASIKSANSSEVAEEDDVEQGGGEDIPNEEEDEYEDEFASMSEDSTAQKAAAVVESGYISDQTKTDSEHGETDGEIAESRSIVSEHSEGIDGTMKSGDSSEVAEDDDIVPGDEADIPNETEEEYEDEFVSMSEDAVEIATVNDNIAVVESGQISDQTKRDSEHSECDYEEGDVEPGDEAGTPNGEEEVYEDEFVSMSEDTVQKGTDHDDVAIAESYHNKSDSIEHIEFDYDVDLSSINESTLGQTTHQGKVSPAVERLEVELEEQHVVEEESLTKSIEERTARLQTLRQKIADRKSEILVVQKQMRAERRKEHLVAEEKVLWDEMESVERLLSADESALTLCRQRNRLEMMHLDARQLEHFVAGRSSKQTNEPELDLLLEFDYVEKAELERRSHTGVYLTTANAYRIAGRGINLLDGYSYIEAAESMNSSVREPLECGLLSSTAVVQDTDEKRHRSESGVEDGMSAQIKDPLCLLDNETNKDREGISGNESAPVHYPPMKKESDQVGFASSHADGDDSHGDENESFVLVQSGGNAAVSGDSEAIVSVMQTPISQEGEEKSNYAVLDQDTYEQVSELDFVNVDCSSTASPQQGAETLELLAEYAYVEIAEVGMEKQAQLSTSDLLVDFDFVEVAEAVEMPPVDVTGDEELHETEKLSNNDYAENEELGHSMSGSEVDIGEQYTTESPNPAADAQMSGAPSVVDHVANNSTVEPEIAVDSAGTSPPQEFAGSRNEVLAQRVASLMYADLLQTLEKDIVSSMRYKRDAQSHHEPENFRLSRMEDTILSGIGVAIPASEIGSEIIDPRHTADWSMDDSTYVESVTRMVTHSETPSDKAVKENEFDHSGRVSALQKVFSFRDDAVHALADEIEISRELPPNEENGQGSLGDTSNNVSIDGSIVASVENAVFEQATPAIDASEVCQDLRRSSENVNQSERVSDAIFATVFDEILSSELRLWSNRATISSPQNTAKIIGGIVPVEKSRESTKCKSNRGLRVRGRKLADRIADQLEIVDGEIHLPEFHALDVGETSSSARVLHETIQDLARNYFDSIQQSTSTEQTLDDASVLAVIHRHIQTEVDELLAIVEQSERELERQLQMISDESENDGGVTGDLLLSHNCVASNVTSIVSKVQSELSRTSEVFCTGAQSDQPKLLPRTPISRAKSTSILSSLQTQQDQELQQRITGLILSDLLHDAGLS